MSSAATGRKPLPPMPRVLPAAAAAAPPTSATQAAVPQKRSGRVLITTGWILLGLLSIDQVLQYLDRQQAADAVAELQTAERAARMEFYQQHETLPTLYETTVKFEYKMSGTRGLKGVVLGDRLEVLQDGVGPNGTYATCRKRDAAGNITSIGWYPVSFMEKVKSTAPSRKKFWGIF